MKKIVILLVMLVQSAAEINIDERIKRIHKEFVIAIKRTTNSLTTELRNLQRRLIFGSTLETTQLKLVKRWGKLKLPNGMMLLGRWKSWMRRGEVGCWLKRNLIN